ncbi:hypothetical protein LguiB_023344 [Lonicera macranthoides]
MADAFVSVLLTQLASIAEQKIRQEVRLVVGVKKEVEKLTNTLRCIQALLVDADKKQVKDKTIKLWLENLKDVSYDTDDVLTEWSTAILELEIEGFQTSSSSNPKKKKKFFFFTSFPCFSFHRVVLRRDIARKIEAINLRLDAIAADKDRYGLHASIIAVVEKSEKVKFTSRIDVSRVRGRDGDKKTLVSNLLCDTFDRTDGGPLHIVSIVGMGGIGKTTLAQLAYNCEQVIDHFEMRLWVCVSDLFDEVRVAKAIVEDANGSAPNVTELETALRAVEKCVMGKKFLLVLDDVCTEDDRKWEPLLITLKSGAIGSKLLVTTRTERVSKMMETAYTLRLKQLSGQECWELFSQIAFSERSEEERGELEDIGRQIADKCKGLPLAAKTIGSLMRFKNAVQDWQSVLDSEIWELEGAEGRLFPPLLLSYYDLPSSIKRCFSYCANFPKDCKIEADSLIKIWMAQGYLTTSGNVEMEITGQEYLETLVMRSFFQDLEKEADSGTGRRTDLAPKRYRHLTIIRGEDAPFPLPAANIERLHTFWIQSFYDSLPIVSEIDTAPPDLFHRLKYVKVLDLSRNRLREIPKEVGKLINLRYLNLSHNPLEQLPEEVCDLYNLQTLKLSACDHLRKLPREMEKLLNLRHLEIDQTDSLRTLPKGISKLSSLRTLSKFVIGTGSNTEEATCKIGDLGNLKHLQGFLKIEGLGYVGDAVEVEKADLKNKENLVDLHIDFTPLVPSEGTTGVAEALQLNTSLQFLQIKSYGGTWFPGWMISLNSLRKLQFQDCQKCIRLPPLGKLQSLETLVIENMDNLKCIGPEFLGVQICKDNDKGAKTNCSTGGSSSMIAFPKLRKLKIVNMSSWEEWDVISTVGEIQGDIIRIMPCLSYLKISDCNKLKALPDFVLQSKLLKKLRIHSSPLLQQRYEKGIGEDWKKISHIKKCHISHKLN